MSESGTFGIEHVADGDWLALRRNLEQLERQQIGRGPAQARVFNNANISITTATLTALTFNSERFDTGNFHSTSANTSRLTAPTAGLYSFGATVEFAAGAGTFRELQLKLNGTTILTSMVAPVIATVVNRMTASSLYQLAAGDYVEAIVFQNSGGALNVNTATNYSPEFWIVRLGSQA